MGWLGRRSGLAVRAVTAAAPEHWLCSPGIRPPWARSSLVLCPFRHILWGQGFCQMCREYISHFVSHFSFSYRLFIWLHHVLGTASRVSSLWDANCWLWRVGSSSLTRDRTWVPYTGSMAVFNHWAPREVPHFPFSVHSKNRHLKFNAVQFVIFPPSFHMLFVKTC